MKLNIDIDTVTLAPHEHLDIHFGDPDWFNIIRVYGNGVVELARSSSNSPFVSVNMKMLAEYLGRQK